MKIDTNTTYYLPLKGLSQVELDFMRDHIYNQQDVSLDKDYFNKATDSDNRILVWNLSIGFDTYSGRQTPPQEPQIKLTYGEFYDFVQQFVEPIKIDGNLVVFNKGCIEVGDIAISNELVREIHNKLID